MSSSVERFTHTVEQYQQERAILFPSAAAVRHFIAQRRELLRAERAYICPVKGYLIDMAAFDRVVELVSQQRDRAFGKAA